MIWRWMKTTQRFTENFLPFPWRIAAQPLRLSSKKIVFLALLLTGCGSAEIKPVDIAAEDVCAHCKMAISEKQFAAEFINQAGDAIKFDDLGCMLEYLKEKPETKIATYFFVDYEKKNWLKESTARFVKAEQISTPMGGGIIAFDDSPRAEAAAVKYQSKVLNFSELLKR